MNKKIESYKKKANKIIKTFKLIGISIFFLGVLISIVQYTINKDKSEMEPNQAEIIINNDEDINSGTGITYYVSANGTSDDGTDINNPMSLKTANTKRFAGNDRVLFKSGDTFYGKIDFSVSSVEKSLFYIGNYGEGKLPKICGAKIISREDVWKKLEQYKDIFFIDLSNTNNFEGIQTTDENSCNIGFIEDEKGIKYYSRKRNISELENDYDFCCDNKGLYIKSPQNPYIKLGTLILSTHIHLVNLSNNTEVDGIKVEYTGGHGIVKKSYPITNVYIHDCVIDNIGGSIQIEDRFVKYGNGIEFWLDASNIRVENNIIRNCYDAGFTLQGDSGKFENVIVKNNIFIQNCFSFELWGSEKSTGMYNVHILKNICISEGKGWGQDARPNKNVSAENVFYSFSNEAKSEINIYNNMYFNPLRIYYVWYGTINRFKNEMKIDNNKFFMLPNAYLFNDENVLSKGTKYLSEEYNVDKNSEINMIKEEQDENMMNQYIQSLDDFEKIKKYYEFFDESEFQSKVDLGSIQGYKYKKNDKNIILTYNTDQETQIPYTTYTATNIFGNTIQNTGTLTISKEPILIYNLDEESLYPNISAQVINKIDEYKQKYSSNLNSSNTMKNVSAKLDNIKQQAEDIKKLVTPVQSETVNKLIEGTYAQGDSIVKALNNKELNIKYEDVCNMLTDLYSITEDMQKYYNTSIGNITKIDKSTEITKNINEFENIYQYYKNENIDYLLKLETMAKQQKEGITNETTNTNNFKTLTAYNLSSWANSLMIMYNDEFLSSISANIEYSNTQLTNQDVIARISSNVDIKVTNNSGKKEYTFTQNGEFTFKCELAGKAFEIKATVTNIDKTPPAITGVENEGFYTGSVTPKVTDTNLKEVKLYNNSTLVQNYATNSPIAQDGNYKIVATDKAGNETTVTFYICKIPATISYSETNLTNKNVTATINSNYDLQVTNNSGKKTYTFTDNSTFTFNYKIKGKAFTVTATVNNIDKKAPVITGVEEGKLYIDQAVIPKVTDENLKEVNLYLNSVQVSNFSSGTQVTKEGFYKIVATDKAGNQTTINFSLMKNNSKEYKVKGKYIINITSNTKKTDFVKNFNNTSQYQVTRNGKALTNNDIIATGDILKSNNGDEYTLIVTGDINKDGDVDIVDIVKLRRYLLLRNNLDEAALLAADCNLDGESLSVTDLVKLRLIVLYKGAT